MARKDATTAIAVSVVSEVTPDGKNKYANRSLRNVNPGLSDDDALSIANKFGALQSREVGAVKRTDTAVLTN